MSVVASLVRLVQQLRPPVNIIGVYEAFVVVQLLLGGSGRPNGRCVLQLFLVCFFLSLLLVFR